MLLDGIAETLDFWSCFVAIRTDGENDVADRYENYKKEGSSQIQ